MCWQISLKAPTYQISWKSICLFLICYMQTDGQTWQMSIFTMNTPQRINIAVPTWMLLNLSTICMYGLENNALQHFQILWVPIIVHTSINFTNSRYVEVAPYMQKNSNSAKTVHFANINFNNKIWKNTSAPDPGPRTHFTKHQHAVMVILWN
jgi:hypothetical protein